MTTLQGQTSARVCAPFPPESLVKRLREHAALRPNSVAFAHRIDGRSVLATLTYGELDKRARAIAARLQDVAPAGQCVMLSYPAGLDFIAAYFGVLYAGSIAVPTFQPRFRTLSRFHALCVDARARTALGTSESIAQLRAMVGFDPGVSWIATDDIPDTCAESWIEHDPHSDSIATIQYTSGSTSQPKGVMLSHANLVANTRAISAAFEVNDASSSVFWLPAYHDMGLIGGVLVPVLCGVPSTVMSPATFLRDPYLWLQEISTSRASISGGPNFAFDLCSRKVTDEQRATLDLSSWSVAFIGAETVQPSTLARFADAFGPCGFNPKAFYPCYGLAEATLMVSGPRAGGGATISAFRRERLTQGQVEAVRVDSGGGHDAHKIVGCGKPVGDVQIQIVDTETLVPVGPGRVGEVWVASESVGGGYWHDPESTRARFAARLGGTQQGPFLRTGDLGFLYERQLYITGRMDDLIIVRGVNHHPQDIEATARDCHPFLENGMGASFSVEREGTQRLVLVQEVERTGEGGGTSDDLAAVLKSIRAAVLEEHGVALDAVVLVRRGTIARTSSGKVQRSACRVAFLNNQIKLLAEYPMRSHIAPTELKCRAAHSAALAAVCQHALAISGTSLGDVSPETPISALSLDSLQRVELVAALDKSFGSHLPDAVYAQAVTLGDLAASVQRHLIDRPQIDAPARETPAEHYDIGLFPEYLELKRLERMLLAVAETNPYFRVDQGGDSSTPSTGGLARINGRELINFSAYDYLGMAHEPRVIAATKAAIDRYGTGASASRLVSGEKQVHGEFERALAAFLGTPASLVFVSGHATNVTTIGHLLGPGDLVVHDSLAHNSILQGAKLSGATCRGFAHNDWQALDTLLTGIRGGFRRVLIAIEGVYSMDGDFPDLARFVEVKQRHRAMLLVDEAHSLGTLGRTGRGIGEHAGVPRHSVDLWMGTLSKSLASCGGYIAGSVALIEYLKYTAPGFVYSVGLSPANAAAALAALELLEHEPKRVSRLRELSELFVSLARARGLNVGRSAGTPVIPIIVGNSIKCLLLSRFLFERGINVQPILHPAVPEHATRLRFFITTNHTEANIVAAVDAVGEGLARL